MGEHEMMLNSAPSDFLTNFTTKAGVLGIRPHRCFETYLFQDVYSPIKTNFHKRWKSLEVKVLYISLQSVLYNRKLLNYSHNTHFINIFSFFYLQDCINEQTSALGKCCRDPNYSDPWPGGMMMMKAQHHPH